MPDGSKRAVTLREVYLDSGVIRPGRGDLCGLSRLLADGPFLSLDDAGRAAAARAIARGTGDDNAMVQQWVPSRVRR